MALAVIFLTLPCSAHENEDFRILIITEFDQRSGPFKTIANAFSGELLRREETPVVLRYVDLYGDAGQSGTDESPHRVLVERVLASERADLVLALGPPAVAFWQNHLASSFSEIPLLACATELGGIDPQYIAGQWAMLSRYSFDGQIAEIAGLLPDTRHVFMIFGATSHERKLAAVAEAQSRRTFEDVEVEFSVDMTIDQIVERVTELRRGSVVYYIHPHTDATGELVSQEEILAKIRAVSQVPVFGPFDNQMGKGIVGGRLIQLDEIGLLLAELAHGIITNQPVARGARYLDLSPPTYDWRELDAWNIPLSQLPPGSQVMFKPPGAWELYRTWIVAIAILVSLQSWLIIQWWIQRRRSRKNAAENITLSRQLITAHEDERKLIARELHDDLSQRLARLSIDASVVASGTRREKNSEMMTDIRQELVQIGKDVHDLSYRLHPSLLNDLGLANALRAECDRIRRLTDMSIVDKIEDFKAELSLDAQLNIYRIAQEALRNAVKHSGGDSVEVKLTADIGGVSLAVRDNGRGFDTANAKQGESLGLLSMRERARLLGSALQILASGGQGTTVRISVGAPP